MKFGLRSITMDDIATNLGISKKTIYNFFTDKDSLVDAVIMDELKCNQVQCDVDRLTAQNAIHEIFLAMQMMQKTFADMNPSILHDLKKYHPKSYYKFTQFKNVYLYNIIKSNLEKGIAEELYRADIDIDIIAKLRVETMLMAFNQELFAETKYTMAFIEQQLMEHFLFGVATLKGYKLIIKYQQERNKNK